MRRASFPVTCSVAWVVSLATITGQAPDRPAVYTADQAAAGLREVQNRSFACTDCHTTALTGRTGAAGEFPVLGSLSDDYRKLIEGNGGRVPPLVGPQFMTRWAGRTTKDLVAEFQRRFEPPMSQFSEEARLNMIAYILQANGALAGRQPLTTATDVTIRALVPLAAPE